MQTKMHDSKLLETQSEDLLKELLSILSEKWTLNNGIGEIYMKKIFESFTDLYNEQEEEEDDEKSLIKSNEIKFNQLNLINECNSLIDKLKELLITFQIYMNRIEKIKNNLIYLINLNLEILNCIESNEFKLVLQDINESYLKEFHLKQDLVNQFIRRARFSQETQINLMSCWINEPFISNDVYLFKLKNYLDSFK